MISSQLRIVNSGSTSARRTSVDLRSSRLRVWVKVTSLMTRAKMIQRMTRAHQPILIRSYLAKAAARKEQAVAMMMLTVMKRVASMASWLTMIEVDLTEGVAMFEAEALEVLCQTIKMKMMMMMKIIGYR